MDPQKMDPFGRAVRAFFEGEEDAVLTVRRDDGVEVPLPASHFFREPDQFSAIERAALDRCRGRVLDVGAGTGLHTLELQRRGHDVAAIDISPEAVRIMRERGVSDARCADVFEFREGGYDTVLMLGHGIGMVETIAGLDRFLAQAADLLEDDGCLLADSVDVRATTDAAHLAYHEANRRAGRYVGEIRVRFAFDEYESPPCGWLHVDPETLGSHGEPAGWSCELVHREKTGEYLARLGRSPLEHG